MSNTAAYRGPHALLLAAHHDTERPTSNSSLLCHFTVASDGSTTLESADKARNLALADFIQTGCRRQRVNSFPTVLDSTAEDLDMGITSTEPKRSHAQILTDYLEGAGLSQRDGAKALRIPNATLRRYCTGSLDTPIPVLLAAQRLPLLDRKLHVIRMLDSGKLSTRR